MTPKHTSFIVTGAILIVVVVVLAVAPYGANVGNTQGTYEIKNTSKTIKMITPGGNTSNAINMTAGGIGKTIKMTAPGINTSNTINMSAREWNLGKTIKIIH